MKDTEFMSAAGKKRVLKQWERFLEGGLKQEQFSMELYQHLRNHCSFIAHYDRAGFYDTYFVNGEDTAHFLTQFDRSKGCKSVEYGDSYWLTLEGYADINNSMVELAARYIPLLTQQAQDRQKQADISRARALLAKHGMTLGGG